VSTQILFLDRPLEGQADRKQQTPGKPIQNMNTLGKKRTWAGGQRREAFIIKEKYKTQPKGQQGK